MPAPSFVPVWRTPTRAQAVDILRTCRARTDELVAGLTPAQRRAAVPGLGDGTWSVKDLLGHLAAHEHRALVFLGARGRARGDGLDLPSNDAFNAHHLAKARRRSLPSVEADYASTRDALVAAIEAMSDEAWAEKVAVGGGARSARGLVLGKMLNGDRFGLFAHDLAHHRALG